MIPVILSGGVGSRLWPLSRGMYPKQLLPLVHPTMTMLQQTIDRAKQAEVLTPPIVVCNQQHRFMVAEQLQEHAPDATIILEPAGRNTAAAIALAAFQATSQGQDPNLLVMPADHVVGNVAAFTAAIKDAQRLSEDGRLVTFGIVPSHPETGYGYIRAGKPLLDGYEVAEFVEKPAIERAQRFVLAGDYYWNGGIFLFRASVYLKELHELAPDIYRAAELAMTGAHKDLDFLRVDAQEFARSPSISVDYAVMEKTNRAAIVPLDAKWSDVGSWSALWDVSSKDANGNVLHGDVILKDTTNAHVYSEARLVAAVGVDDLVIVETADAVLVASKACSQAVKEIVSQLKASARSQSEHHRKVYRPWGWYDSIDTGLNFQVKRIQVSPGARLSVQKHRHRAEHWVVVKGLAEVLKGDETFQLTENQSTYIPIGVKHALRNPSDDQPLEIIEVQSGSYLGEDDIVRYDDDYGRAGTSA